MGGGPPETASEARRPSEPLDVLWDSQSEAAGRHRRLAGAAARPLRLAANGLRRLWARSGIACILGAAFFFSWAATFVKLIEQLQPEITIFLIIAIRSLLSVIASCAAARRLPLAGSAATAPLLVLRGLCGACAMTLFYAALNRIPLADTLTLMFLNPAICALLGWALLGEHASWRTAAGCLASLAGVACVAQPPFLFGDSGSKAATEAGSGSGRLAGVGMAVLSAFFAAGAYITVRTIGSREPPVVIAFAFHLASLLTSLVPLALGLPRPAVLPRLPAAACLLAVTCCSFAAQLLLSRGFQLETATKASAANLTQVLCGQAIGLVLFHERTSALGLLGAALVVAGVAAVTADKQQHQQGAAAVGLGSKPGQHAAEAPVAQLTPPSNGVMSDGRLWRMGEDVRDEEAAGEAAAAATDGEESCERGSLLPPGR